MISFTSNITKKQSSLNNNNVYVAEAAASYVANLIIKQAQKVTSSQFAKASQSLAPGESTLVNNGAEYVLNKLSGLSQKGVKIIDFNPKDGLNNYELQYYKASPKTYEEVARGANAFFTSKDNIVALNKEKLSLSAFHELGHAYNYNSSPFWKTIQKIRHPLVCLAGAIALLPARMKEVKPKDGEELSFKDKFKNKLRKYFPLVVGGCMLPTLAEEGMATIRGNKWAKEALNSTPELAKKVSKVNKWGFISYALATAGLMLTSYFARKFSDKFNKTETNNTNSTILKQPLSFDEFSIQSKNFKI